MTVEAKGESKGRDDSVRVDIWTWAVRLYKTRAFSGAACKKEQVLINGQRCRASRHIRVGDVIQVRRGALTRTVAVKAILSKRVGPKVVADFLIDQTPAEEYEKAAEIARQNRASAPQRGTGTGRPTKRDRRHLEQAMNEMAEAGEDFEEFVNSFLNQP